MKKSIMINGTPFEYEAVNLKWEDVPVVDHDSAKELLFTAKNLLDDKGINFFLIYGTLLGAIREHDFIAHDYDVDIATTDIDKVVSSIPEWYEKGFKLCRVVGDRLYSFEIKGFYIDIYAVKPCELLLYKSWCRTINANVIPYKYLFPLKTIDFLGADFMIPERADDLIKFFYGKNWRTPIKGAHGKYDVRSYYYWKKIRIFCGKIIGKRNRRWIRIWFKKKLHLI